MVQYESYPPQVMVYMGMGAVWENLTHGIPVRNPSVLQKDFCVPSSEKLKTF